MAARTPKSNTSANIVDAEILSEEQTKLHAMLDELGDSVENQIQFAEDSELIEENEKMFFAYTMLIAGATGYAVSLVAEAGIMSLFAMAGGSLSSMAVVAPLVIFGALTMYLVIKYKASITKLVVRTFGLVYRAVKRGYQLLKDAITFVWDSVCGVFNWIGDLFTSTKETYNAELAKQKAAA
jgi:hypothetical protein